MRLKLTMLLREALEGASRIALLGVGSELRGDDRAGLLVTERLRKRCTINGPQGQIDFFYGATAPENLTGEIKNYRPSHLLLIDTVDFGKAPGTIEILCPELIAEMSFSTHIMPLKVLMEYMRQSLDCKVLIIGIQPKAMEYDTAVSPEIRNSIARLVMAIETVAKEVLGGQAVAQ